VARRQEKNLGRRAVRLGYGSVGGARQRMAMTKIVTASKVIMSNEGILAKYMSGVTRRTAWQTGQCYSDDGGSVKQ